MRTPSIGTRLKWLGIPKSFFTKSRTNARVREFVRTMWKRRNAGIVDPNTWNEASLVYGYLPLWNEPLYKPDDIIIGEDVE